MKKRIVKKSAKESDFESLVTPELLARAGASALQPLLDFPLRAKRETPSPESQLVETVTPQTMPAGSDLLHRLSFSHLAELLGLPDDTQRRFYEIECIRGNWSVRELRRQIDSLYYQRSGLSKTKAKLSAATHGEAAAPQPSACWNAPSGLGSFVALIPRALPWADMDRRVAASGMSGRAESTTKNIHLGMPRLRANGAPHTSLWQHPGKTGSHSSQALKERPNA